MLWNMITDFLSIYKNSITGRYDSKRYNVQSMGKKDLIGGAKIKIKFYDLYKDLSNYNAS